MSSSSGTPYSPLRDAPSPRRSRSSSDSNASLRALEISDGIEPMVSPLAQRGRTLSISSGMFEFQSDLLPLSLSETERVEQPAEKTVGLVNGIALVVGLQIGSGIFSSPGVVLANTSSVGASLIVWLVGGLLAWTGASSFAELGSAIPLNGGAQAYLAYAYNPLVSYLFAWTAISALKPGSNAIIALIFGEYVNRLLFHATVEDSAPDSIPSWAIKLTACLAVMTVSILCVATPNLGTRAAVLFTTVKLAALLAITILGIIQLARGKASSSLTEPLFEGTSPNPSSWALALYSALWSYDGFDQINYVGGEMKNPEKNIPRAIHSSMAIVLTLFLSANVSYFVLLDKSTVGRSNTVALDFGRELFGAVGAIVFAAMVAFSCFGALNGSFFTSARLIYVAGRERFLPALFGRLHPTRKTPVNAMALQAVLTMFFIILGGGFRSLVNFYSVASWLFYFLTVMGLVVLRVKEPHLERPYKTYITTPLIFSAVALFLLTMPVIAAPLEALAAFGFILAGVPLYYLTQRPSKNTRIRESEESLLSSVTSCLSNIRSMGRARSSGYGRVSTGEGEEQLEMLETRRNAGS